MQPSGNPPAFASVDDPTRLRYVQRKRFILTDLVMETLAPSDPFVIIDGGASSAFDDPRWQVFDSGKALLHGFEPDAEECARLNAMAREKGLAFHFHPIGLWSSNTDRPFHQNFTPGGSSFYELNKAFSDRWWLHTQQAGRDILRETGEIQVPCISLHDWACRNGVTCVDFMKLNVQGAELEILKGCGDLLNTILGLQVEVSFCESYHGRPFFSDIDCFLRRAGFSFFDLIAPQYIKPVDSPVLTTKCPGIDQQWARGHLIEGHAVYFRDSVGWKRGHEPLDISDSWQRLLKLAAFAEIWGQIEFAFEVLGWLRGQLDRLGRMEEANSVGHIAGQGADRYVKYMWFGR